MGQETHDAQLEDIMLLASKDPRGGQWVHKLEQADTVVVAAAIADLVGPNEAAGDASRLRESALTMVQARVIKQLRGLVSEVGRLIETTERLEQSATRLQWVAIGVGIAQLLTALAVVFLSR